MLPIVAIASNYDSSFESHTVFDRYVSSALQHAECTPLLIPCIGHHAGSESQTAALLQAIDGLLLPGGLSNIHPSEYSAQVSGDSGTFDESRDATTMPLIRAAVTAGIPVLGICRGAQELNCAFGGTLHQAVHKLPGCLDHRARKDIPQHLKYGPVHSIRLSRGSWLELALSRCGVQTDDLAVNSLHSQAIADLGAGLVVDARAPDGIIEAISMPDAPALTVAVQWHPEWHIDKFIINFAVVDTFRGAVHSHYRRRDINARPGKA